ncbi:MAG: thiamine-phosphate diphosphorylase [Herbinix sp.]|nr:thiamine-phosphate diphosphorylase [Herbinix sp.]
MKIKKEDMLLYIVTDRTWLGDHTLADQVEKTLQSGATFLQLREKDLSYDEFVELAYQIKTIANRYHVPFVINDNIDVAQAVGADGVHIGQTDEDILKVRDQLGPEKIIGLSAHTTEEAILAEQLGADYIGVGAIFPTNTKLDANAVSYSTLQDICKSVTIPVVAIGGISKENISKLSGSGVDGVAVISAVFAQPDISYATKDLLERSRQMV